MHDYIVIRNGGGTVDDEILAVDTPEEIAAAERELAERGIASAPVWRGEAPDAVKTDLVVFAAADPAL